MRLMLALLAVAGAAVAVAEGEPVRDVTQRPAAWPGWRGPTGDGVSRESGFPTAWSAADERGKPLPRANWQNILWAVDVPGKGHSSPIVLGDQVFLTALLDDKATRAIIAFRRDDGKELWRAQCPSTANEKLSGEGKKAGHAAPTPATDGERVYAYFGPAGVFCTDLKGKQCWHVELPGIDHVWGTGASPVIYNDLVIVNCDNEGPSYLLALNTKDGKEAWKTKRPAGGGWSTPLVITHDGRDELIVSGKDRVTAYDPKTGEELWHCNGLTDTVCPTPVYGHGLVFAVSGRNGPTLAIKPGGKGDVTESRLAWDRARGGPSVPSPILVGDYLYMVNDGGLLTCYEAKTGKQAYQERLDGSFSASPVAAGEVIYFLNEEGVAQVVAAGPKFKVLASSRLGEACFASPALVGGKVYLRTAKRLICTGAK